MLLIGFWMFSNAHAENIDFSNEYNQIYQIRSVSNDAEAKSSIGSGFQVSASGLIITNYHVVSDFISEPDSYALEYADQHGNKGSLTLLDFDIVNDLALLQHPNPRPEFFELAGGTPERGVLSYALGNPGDWGMVMVPGPTNGFVEHSYRKLLLFSGSLNSGMSGGPSLNANKRVVGVNVATAGSQLSFLVPVEHVSLLVENPRELKPAEFDEEVTRQLKAWQRPRLQQLIEEPWDLIDFHGRSVASEFRYDFQCWGGSNDDDDERKVNRSYRQCSSGDDIYVNRVLNTSQVEYFFAHRTTETLNPMQFALYQGMGMGADNNSSYKYSTNYVCESSFLSPDDASDVDYTRMVSCIRAYKKFPGLYDSMVMILSQIGPEIVKSHITIAGAEKDQIMALNRKFAEAVQ